MSRTACLSSMRSRARALAGRSEPVLGRAPSVWRRVEVEKVGEAELEGHAAVRSRLPRAAPAPPARPDRAAWRGAARRRVVAHRRSPRRPWTWAARTARRRGRRAACESGARARSEPRRPQICHRDDGELPDGGDPHRLEAGGGDPADSPEARHRRGARKSASVPGATTTSPSGLLGGRRPPWRRTCSRRRRPTRSSRGPPRYAP